MSSFPVLRLRNACTVVPRFSHMKMNGIFTFKWGGQLHDYLNDLLQDLLRKVIDEHKANYEEDLNGDSRDFIDAFLAEMNKEGSHESFEELQLLVGIQSNQLQFPCLIRN